MAPGAVTFIIIVILIIVAVAWTSFGRRRGSGIGSHPIGAEHGGAPGADGPSETDHDHTEQRPGDFGTR
ncbi:MAG TPA: hypothetical protein VF533_13185 [Solirubrobacteraceae bacterium]|jgi:hypothetical protein